ncbi:MAG: flagellar M-ring protein FliF [Alphaproteobacteria bacterium]|nr:flagellar M-ring protein FliF [Alphaproteobacteria bacterium]
MENFLTIWSNLSASRRALLLGAIAATMTAFGVSMFSARNPQMSLLYAGLDPQTSGEVLMALERLDVTSEARGDAIFVPTSKRDSVRLSLAREGLPAKNQAGYELLDELSGFSTTSEMFDAAYWRAKEGELARTILSVPGVRSARVHIGAAKRTSFDANKDANSAVVTVSMARGPLTKQQALAVRYLVSLAVAGLPEEKVAVIDAERGVVLRPGDGAPEAEALSMAAERERELEARLTSLIEARVGAGSARVSVALELDMEREALSERILDPESRVTTGRETTDITQNSSGTVGAVTVASNLPDGDAGSDQRSSSQRNEARERIDYEFSEVRREREKRPGAVKRLSVAVLVDAVRETDPDGVVSTTARSEEEIESLRLLVESAIGFNEARGDVVTVETLEFQAPVDSGPLVTASPINQFLANNAAGVIKVLIPSLVTLLIGLFVIKPVLSQGAAPRPAELAKTDALPTASISYAPAAEATPEIEAPQDSMDKLKEIAAAKQEETASLLKSWLDRAEEPA